MTQTEVQELHNHFRELVGFKCWRVFCGPSTGTILDVSFGPLIQRTVSLSKFNPTLSDEERIFEGSRSLYIECGWRLQNGDTSLESDTLCDDDVPMFMSAMDELAEKVLTSVEFDDHQPLDLCLVFADSVKLFVSCAQSEAGTDNYSLFLPDRIITVDSSLEATISPRG